MASCRQRSVAVGGLSLACRVAADARRNATSGPIDLPLLYLRGDADGRSIDDYLSGLTAAGARNLKGETVQGSGEYLLVEAPERFVAALRAFRESRVP